jgi:hypothetical protein
MVMALDFQPLHVNFGEGVDTRTDSKAVLTTKLLRAQNVVFTAPGALTTRFGWEQTSVGVFSRRIVKRGDELMLVSDGGIMGRTPSCLTSQIAGVSRHGTVRETGYTADETDCAIYGNRMLVMTRLTKAGASKITVTVTELDTGKVIQRTDTLIAANATMPRCVTVGTYIVMMYLNAAGTELRYRRYNAATDAFGADTLFQNGVTGKYDLTPLNASQFIVVVQRDPGGANRLYAYKLDDALTTLLSTSFVFVTTLNIAIYATNGELLWYAFRDNGTGELKIGAIGSADFATGGFAPVVVIAGYPSAASACQLAIGRISATQVRLFFLNATAGLTQYIGTRFVTSAGVVTMDVDWLRLRPGSKPWVQGGVMRMIVGYFSGLQGTAYVMTFLYDATVSQLDAIIARSAAGIDMLGSLPSVPQTETAGVYKSSLIVKTKLNSQLVGTSFGVSTESSGTDIVTFDHVSAKRFCTAELGGLMYIAGGMLRYYDGSMTGEVGFAEFPERPTTAAAAGGAVTVGTHQVVTCWAYTDSFGNTHRSSPSPADTINVGGGTQTLNITQVPLDLSLREQPSLGSIPSHVILEWYMAAAASSGPFYRVQAPSACPNNTPNVEPTLTFAAPYASADATLTAGPKLYTTGDVLPNVPPPSTDVICTHQNRLMVVSAEDGRLWFSKEYIVGEAPGFNDALTFQLPTAEQPIALASFDDKLVIWTATEIHVLSGDFPNDQGLGSTLHSERVASDVGGIDWRSVVVTHVGAFFLSVKGIMLLTRGLQVVFAGSDVRYWTDNYSECVAAYVTPDRDEVRFHMKSPVAPVATPTAQTLVLNFRAQSEASPYGQWSHFDDALGDEVSAAVVAGDVYKIVDTGELYVESREFSDAGDWITVDVETANIYPFGRQAQASIRTATLLGRTEGQHALELQVAYDDDPGFVESSYFAAADLALIDREQVGHHLQQQKCSGIRLRITTYEDGAAPNAGVTLSGVALEAAQRRGTKDRSLPKEARQ